MSTDHESSGTGEIGVPPIQYSTEAFALTAGLYGLQPDADPQTVLAAVGAQPELLVAAYARVHEAVYRDDMTGLLNKRSFRERFLDLTPEELEQKGVMALLLIDVDNFKRLTTQRVMQRATD